MSPVAIAFVRRTGADGIGHVGWAFTDDDDIFSVGSVENPHHTLRTRPQQMGFWVLRTRDPVAPMQARGYTELKVINLRLGDPVYAWQVVTWHRRKPYDIIGRNCMDVTYDVLRAFGVADLPVPAHHWEPNHWFDHLHGRHYSIDRDEIVLLPKHSHISPTATRLAQNTRRSFALRGIASAIPAWRRANTWEWIRLHADLAVAHLLPLPDHALLETHPPSILAWIRSMLRSRMAKRS